MCLIFERPAPETPNIYGMCQCLCLIEDWGRSYAKHDCIRKQSFERDTHVDDGSVRIGRELRGGSPARLDIALLHARIELDNDRSIQC